MTTSRTVGLLAAAAVVYVVASAWMTGTTSIVAIDVLGVTAVGFAWWGAYRQSARGRAAWAMSAFGLTLWVLGDLIWDQQVITGTSPTVSAADVFYIAGYPVLVLATVLMIRQRASGHWRAALADAIGVGLAAGLAAWVFLVPSLESTRPIEVAVTVAYPLADVVLLAALIWLVLSPGIRGLPSALALSGIVATLLLDVTQSIAPIAAHETLAAWLDNAYPLAYLLVAFASCHQRSVELTLPDPAPDGGLQPARIVFLGFALFTGPIIGTLTTSTTLWHRVLVMATTVLIGTIVLARFIGALREIEQARLAISVVAGTDSLTGLDNRRRFLEGSDRVIDRLHHDGESAAALMIDIDHFKQINDTHGHAAGDAVLVELARRCNLAIRPHDLLGRLGGDEFAIVLTRCDIDGAAQVGARLQQLVAERPFVLPGSAAADSIEVTLSIGATAGAFASVDEALADADTALYEAKRGGRNRMWIQRAEVAVDA